MEKDNKTTKNSIKFKGRLLQSRFWRKLSGDEPEKENSEEGEKIQEEGGKKDKKKGVTKLKNEIHALKSQIHLMEGFFRRK